MIILIISKIFNNIFNNIKNNNYILDIVLVLFYFKSFNLLNWFHHDNSGISSN